MNAQSLQEMQAGFAVEALGSQAAFRVALQALSHPGRVWPMPIDAECPAHGHAAAAVSLLALLDADCTLWLSPTLAGSSTAAWLRFHTGCTLVTEPAQAQFAWVAQGDEVPDLAAFMPGTDTDPETSTTLVIDVAGFNHGNGNGDAFTLSGPGIATTQPLQVQGLPNTFAEQWAHNHDAFPRGVDVLLASPATLAGLPRSTRIAASAELEN
ncbi:alpha-D-ribose 1-methylphosphonate 5-triphosphate synthase subunit PhnH [Hydrogenophaga palleronii]|uniref:Alpha-D-ribose 1-methylphosphonate 5-triphosphate synthase subunit PhnH n=1 Tax=Hydrogenophaga palleronii TaxID=65655 RepID=A0ABU1WQN2_9BURK|nr:phosphonate C-P lyase system protein PhnH [Hydrogenophaga palleronii]MDR7151609.1 alpha-D-ribose 1-methylphosphonate 5-triphosphate synthase subunit PhnH [Hydrogenophaga palleronii]